MGLSIDECSRDAILFNKRLKKELDLFRKWCDTSHFENDIYATGCELEFYILNGTSLLAEKPNRSLSEFFDKSSFIVKEFGDFSYEINAEHCPLDNKALSKMQVHLNKIWSNTKKHAKKSGHKLLLIGGTPNIPENSFSSSKAHLSDAMRFVTLEEESAYRLPANINIQGDEQLHTSIETLAAMSAGCSYQIHMQLKFNEATQLYNAAQMIAAPVLAISTNSYTLFGKRLWHESRVPFLEQMFYSPLKDEPYPSRVFFGKGYLHSIDDYFTNAVSDFHINLPCPSDRPPEEMWHLRLHNSTVYGWNRLVIGQEKNQLPHLRVEFRALPAGPTIEDMLASTAFYYGLVTYFSLSKEPLIPFEYAKANFYEAAQHGLYAKLKWINGRTVNVAELIRELIPLAQEGLRHLNISADDVEHYLGIIQSRTSKMQTGSIWQLKFLEKNNNDITKLVSTYYEHQESGAPVHEWKI